MKNTEKKCSKSRMGGVYFSPEVIVRKDEVCMEIINYRAQGGMDQPYNHQIRETSCVNQRASEYHIKRGREGVSFIQ